jgi:hypothetical protein
VVQQKTARAAGLERKRVVGLVAKATEAAVAAAATTSLVLGAAAVRMASFMLNGRLCLLLKVEHAFCSEQAAHRPRSKFLWRIGGDACSSVDASSSGHMQPSNNLTEE